MTSVHFILASLRHHWRMHVAVGLGVAVATAVLTGALLVGDSVRGSLRDLTLERLGRIDSALVTGHFFRQALADDVHGEPAILMPGTVEAGSGDDTRRATQISIVGCRPEFWSLGQGGPKEPLAAGSVAITEPLARELGVKVDDTILLRIPAAKAIPADSSLGKKDDTSVGRRLRVADVLPASGLARFALQPSQQLPRNVFVPLATLQAMLDQPGRANAILVAGEVPDGEFKPQLTDYGLRVDEVATPTKYVSLSSEQLVLPEAVVVAAEYAFAGGELQPVVTYLANSIVVGSGDAERKIPYSTITGADSIEGMGPLAEDEIALNRWAADDLGAKVGDMVTVNYYEPESTHGVLREHQPPLRLRLAQIVELEKDGQPTAAADPNWTPELKGVTDADSIGDWDVPFELVEKIRPQDEDYWNEYRTTPKAFVSLALAKRLWATRWGTISLLRIPTPAGETASAVGHVTAKLEQHLHPADLGMTFLPVKQLGLAASSGTTPFDALFLGFSFFLIAAAVMLISLLFKLGVDARAKELGTLGALGLPPRKIASLLSDEGLLVAALGAIVGIVLGIAYAWLIITGLRSWWVAAVSTPFLTLHVTQRSLLIGALAGMIVSWLTIRWSIRRLARLPVGRLLAGVTETPADGREKKASSSWPRMREAIVALAVALCVIGYLLQGESQAGVFFASGATVLALLLGEVRYQLRKLGRSQPSQRTLSLVRLSAINTARHPGRSTLTIGLVAMATFLIAAISAFRLDTGVEGTGGFTFLATSDQPIHFDLNTAAGRTELAFSDADDETLSKWKTYALRVAAGEDASCLNLYRPTQPRVLGLPESLIERGGFGWADAMKVAKIGAPANPWSLLDSQTGDDAHGRAIVPVVLDMSTAIYSMHLSGVGAQFTIRDAADRPVTLEVVGLLKNSVLQGNLLVSEANFLKLFPDVGGYRFFLIEESSRHAPRAVAVDVKSSPHETSTSAADGTRSVPATAIARALESTLAADGFDVVDAKEQLAGFLAVQNTYLSTFQSLGALGLLLGTFGLAVVQLRSVLERRGELALMRAEGFRPGRLVEMVVFENGVLLLGGLVVGLAAAVIALLPQWAPQGASVPWLTLAGLLGTIAAVGLGAGWLATRSAVETPIVATLRGE
jgi:ABC-type antimicrobial peptide transport system permease subunit